MAIKQHGIVVDVRDQTAIVKLAIHESCDRCGACDAAPLVSVPNSMHAHIGQSVEIQKDPHGDMQLIFIELFVPVLSILAGSALGYCLSISAKIPLPVALTLSISGFLGTGFVVAMKHDRQKGRVPVKAGPK